MQERTYCHPLLCNKDRQHQDAVPVLCEKFISSSDALRCLDQYSAATVHMHAMQVILLPTYDSVIPQ